MARARSSNQELKRVVRSLPGYDPYADAGDCHFDDGSALRAIGFIESCCKHVKGKLAGKPLMLDEYERAIVANLFGWLRPDGTRRYREAFIFLPRKNGKSTLCAAIALFVLCCDGEAGAECYCAAADRDQAALIYGIAKGMVANEPEMAKRIDVHATSKTLLFGDSYIRAISAEANTKHGYNAHLALIDELHAQPSRELVDVLMTSTANRRQPLVIHITTSDYDRPSICNQKHDYATKVRAGEIADNSFLPVLYQASAEDDWTSPETWAKANPGLGHSLSLEYMKRECQRAIDEPEYENTFKRLHLNIRTTTDVRWMQMERWDACAGAIAESALMGRRCHAGLDLASRADLASFAMVFAPDDDDPYWRLLVRTWVPRKAAERRTRAENVPYLTWIADGWLLTCDGDRHDYEAIRRQIEADCAKFNIGSIGADRWNLEYMRQLLGDIGAEVFEFGQGYRSMSEPCKEFKSMVDSGSVRHDGSPLLRWCAGNVVIEVDSTENIKPSKKKSTDKIDPIVATIMAIGRARSEMVSESVYDTRGILTLG